jgi:metal-responsive CopG/Arc/MetJ family transcriptional regulator
MSATDNRNPPEPDAEKVSVALEHDLLAGIEAYSSTQKDSPSRPDAVRRILREWLQSNGFIRSLTAEEGRRPEDLNSANDD